MILLINDDGIHAPGLRTPYAALRKHCQCPVLAVAPAREQSGQSQAITIHRSLRVTPHHERSSLALPLMAPQLTALQLALTSLCGQRPQLVVSGINHGPNVGRSIFYSGTVGAAMESAVMGYAAVACSQDVGAEQAALNDACKLCAQLIEPPCAIAATCVQCGQHQRSGNSPQSVAADLSLPTWPQRI